MSNATFGKELKRLREEKNLTQAELAEKAGLTAPSAFTNISHWERGVRGIPPRVVVQDLDAALAAGGGLLAAAGYRAPSSEESIDRIAALAPAVAASLRGLIAAIEEQVSGPPHEEQPSAWRDRMIAEGRLLPATEPRRPLPKPLPLRRGERRPSEVLAEMRSEEKW